MMLGAKITDVWHTQLRIINRHMPEAMLRAHRTMDARKNMIGGTFCYVTPTVRRRETTCPAHVVQAFRDLGYIIIHIEEPQS